MYQKNSSYLVQGTKITEVILLPWIIQFIYKKVDAVNGLNITSSEIDT